MEEGGINLIDLDYWRRTGKPGHGVIEISNSSETDEDSDGEKGIENERKSSNEGLDERRKAEKLMFYFVSEGDVEGMREVMKRYPEDIRVNVKDRRGWTMLMWAVIEGDVDVVGAVLREVSPDWVDLEGGLMKAVERNKMECLKEILLFEKEREYKGGKKGRRKAERKMEKLEQEGWEEDEGLAHSGEFGVEVTPLMMASIKENREIMELLWKRGERMPNLHFPSCSCRICYTFGRDVERSEKRVKLLEAMTGREWLFFGVGRQASWDPLWEGIKVMEMADRCAAEELEFAKEYERVKWKLEGFLEEMVAECRTEEEIRLLLEGRKGRKSRALKILREAAQVKMRGFLTNESIQWYLEKDWRAKKRIGFYARFASYKSYIIVMVSLGSENIIKSNDELDSLTYWLRWILAFFWVSHLIDLVTRSFRNRRYFWSSPWNKLHVVICLLLLVTFYEWFWEAIIYWRKPSFDLDSSSLEDNLKSSWIIELGRWSYGIAITLSILGLLQYTLLLPYLGPIQSCLLAVNEGKWKPIPMYLLVTIVLVMAMIIKHSGDVWWKSGGFTAILVVSTLILTFLQVAGNGVFCSNRKKCGRGDQEYNYRKAVEMIRQKDHGSDFPPPFNLFPANLLHKYQEEDEEATEEWQILMFKLYKISLRKSEDHTKLNE